MAKNGNIHPRRLFKEPEELLKVWEEYKLDVEQQSKEWLKVQYVGKEGQRVTDGQKVPYTYEGFKRFCREHYGEVQQYFENKDGYYTHFVDICCAIKEEIRENQIIGGLLGFYNPSITQRLNKLQESTNVINNEGPLNKVDLSKLTDEELEFLDKIANK